MKRENMTFYYYGLEIQKELDDTARHPYSDYFTNVDTEYEVDKNRVIEALIEILRETPDFVDMEDEAFEKYVEDHWEELGDKHYEELRDYFEEEATEKAEEEYEEPEYDPYEPDPDDFYDESFSKGMFEELDSEDPDRSYSTYHDYDVMEGIGSYDPEEERYEYITSKSVQDADGFYTDYTLYKDTQENKYITIFGDNDIYDPETTEADAEFETKEEALEWFNNYKGFEEEEEETEEDLLEEDKDPYIPLTVNDRFDPNGYKEDTSEIIDIYNN